MRAWPMWLASYTVGPQLYQETVRARAGRKGVFVRVRLFQTLSSGSGISFVGRFHSGWAILEVEGAAEVDVPLAAMVMDEQRWELELE